MYKIASLQLRFLITETQRCCYECVVSLLAKVKVNFGFLITLNFINFEMIEGLDYYDHMAIDDFMVVQRYMRLQSGTLSNDSVVMKPVRNVTQFWVVRGGRLEEVRGCTHA